MAISKDEFRAALSRFPSGVTVVTTKDKDGRLHGITVSAFCSVSLEPPLILVCIDKTTGSHPAFDFGGTFVVNVLREDQAHLSNHFASLIADKFDRIEYRKTSNGVPILVDALVNLECRLVSTHEGGDHSIFVGEIQNIIVKDGKPLLYFQGNYRSLKD
jgi:flavin reductase (DIM6/NTAB) family NADH-FMN oxidoreductase RutF